jgi:Fur family transcriptional regulator, stress-responsive regulator
VTSDTATARLRASGYRVTRQRLAVFEALAELGGHRGVDEIADWLRARGEPLPITSVYNAIEALEGADLVSAAHSGPPRALYEVRGPEHAHFICRVCGDISDVDLPPGRRAPPPLPGVVIDAVDVTYRGVCATCAPSG